MTETELQASLYRAVSAHDLDAVTDLVRDERAMRLLQLQVLPWAMTNDVVWFWRSIQANQFSLLCNKIRDACSAILMGKGFQPGEGFSWGREDDLPTLLVRAGAHACLIKTLPPERYSTARIVIREEASDN